MADSSSRRDFLAALASAGVVGVDALAADAPRELPATGADLGSLFRLATTISYDATQNLVLEDRTLLTYKGSCFTIFVEYRELRVPPQPRHDVRLVVNLKGIGTLLDVNGSLDALASAFR